ncbi:hypothetical protein [Methylobacterium pseudosasicola]|uniref:Uncharacterized protein n=1 Tax=Methylobacterium pseudosasicola TaxID=582667 RepID=A0A1I4UD37_9HYPH|nr:hypothetical protein [Methylobacterium pseudosasicola]SFM86907.1 hypothetical protein SAMN05192568_10686 [Methylobacterium pseudosasicola]
MAHKNMTLDFVAGPPAVFFQVYDKPKGSVPVFRIMRTGCADLGWQSIRVGLYAHKVVVLSYQIFTWIPLEPAASFWAENPAPAVI